MYYLNTWIVILTCKIFRHQENHCMMLSPKVDCIQDKWSIFYERHVLSTSFFLRGKLLLVKVKQMACLSNYDFTHSQFLSFNWKTFFKIIYRRIWGRCLSLHLLWLMQYLLLDEDGHWLRFPWINKKVIHLAIFFALNY